MAEQAGAQSGQDRAQSPWPMRVVAIITVVSIAAIALGIFLPREQQEFKPVAGQQVAENPAPNAQAQQWQQWQTQQPQQQANSQAMAPAPTQQQQTETQQQQQQQPQQQQYPQQQQQAQQFPQQQAQQQSQQQQQQAQTQTWSGHSTAGVSPPTAQPATAGAAPTTSVGQPGAQRAPQASPTQGPLFTPQEASDVVRRVEELQGGGSGLSADQRGLLIAALDPFTDQRTWQEVKRMLPEWLAEFQKGEVDGISPEGLAEIQRIIAPSRTGPEAARLLERAWGWQQSPVTH